MKGETIEELDGLLDAMLAVAAIVEVPPAVHEQLVDIVGTGGDRSHTINVSTHRRARGRRRGRAGVQARQPRRVVVVRFGRRARGARRRASTSTPTGVARCIEEAGIGFCFAPRFHPALRHAGPTRRELGVPTMFNFLGPAGQPGTRRDASSSA